MNHYMSIINNSYNDHNAGGPLTSSHNGSLHKESCTSIPSNVTCNRVGLKDGDLVYHESCKGI